jgi:hypothetical protein
MVQVLVAFATSFSSGERNDVALEIDERATAVHHAGACFELRVEDRAEIGHVQLDRGERFVHLQQSGARHPHGGIGEVAEDPAVHRAHRIRVFVAARFEPEDGRSALGAHRFESDQRRDRRREQHGESLGRLPAHRALDRLQHIHRVTLLHAP